MLLLLWRRLAGLVGAIGQMCGGLLLVLGVLMMVLVMLLITVGNEIDHIFSGGR